MEIKILREIKRLIALDGLIIFISGYLSKTPLKLLNYILILTLLPLASMVILINQILIVDLDFYHYIALILLTGGAFLSVWVFPALNGDYKKVAFAMNFVTGIVVLISMVLFALVEVLPEGILESCLSSLISKGNTYDIWSRRPYRLARFVIMAGSFPYIASFIISKMILSLRAVKGDDNLRRQIS